MSQDVCEIVCVMDMKKIETQLALQCAPLIAGLKLSNLLIIPLSLLPKVKQLLKGSWISYYVLYITGHKATVLLYSRTKMEDYLCDPAVTSFLVKEGYEDVSCEGVLAEFRKRCLDYVQNNAGYPHEIGIILGYPLEDIVGFIEHQGQNYLYTGYWKVYCNVEEKINLFERYEKAKEDLIRKVHMGVNINNIINAYQEI